MRGDRAVDAAAHRDQGAAGGGRLECRALPDRRPERARKRVGGELGRVELARAQSAELGSDLPGSDPRRVGDLAASRASVTAAHLAAAKAAPHPLAVKPASPIRSPSMRSERLISSQQAPLDEVTVTASSGLWPWP